VHCVRGDGERGPSTPPQRQRRGASLAVRYTKLAVNKLVKDTLNVAFDASTALALVTFQSEDIGKRWRRCARSACPSSRIVERCLPP
jgi:hypothetical protein